MSTERTAILVGTDGSTPSDRAIGWAAGEAARLGKELHILHVLETPTKTAPGNTGGDRASLVDAWNPVLRAGRDTALLRHPRLKVETMLVHDRTVAGGLRHYAGEAAEVVVGHRGRGGFASLLLGSTGLHLAGRFPGPVTIVRGHSDTPLGEVVVGLDLAGDPAPALDHAFAAAAVRGSRLRVLHAWRPAAHAVDVDAQLAAGGRYERLAAALAPWRGRHTDLKVVEDVVVGHPVQMLAQASAEADLLVVGSRGRSFPLGSVGHGVIHHAHCPVAVVRPRGD
ncbi:nucleotide-binding universal stress UspA family protein [Actinomadura luteofluorescens]|uniref:Nucleotide-binding universal stress UspA family protein n=1 Tax=Actinomadura luteofluorescens TaxID=46163 RepID=A0A7Y9ECB0_9ACTN|nr:universal stress protein [Actinomadura luteofluorescens]NYD45027.1 nucleotide-binding universal stress UspA family protein [Actinomadura luteofluorescens]